ncbi:MAG: hypothetical protein EXR28_16090 [Betaproteobacteria bacterium]|nr:hypothetical protein [Betaproteobacteria bacterium]
MIGKVNLDRWMPQLNAAKREGLSLARYAKTRGLSRYTLYAAREWIRKANGKPLPAWKSITSDWPRPSCNLAWTILALVLTPLPGPTGRTRRIGFTG